MKFIKTLLASSISLLLLGTVGCSDNTTQDTQQEDATSFTGLVIDGRIARGFVWIDTDDDGILDIHEPYTYTDGDGYFSYNPLTNTDYCEDVNHQYCLKTGMVEGDFIIRIAGGIDLSTGEPFFGVMKLQSNTNDAKEVEQQVLEITDTSSSKPGFLPVISPLTSLVGSLTDAEKAELLTKIGITDVDEFNVEDLLTLDFTDFTTEEDDTEGSAKSQQGIKGAASQQTLTNINTFGAAFQYQKTVDAITDMLGSHYEKNGLDLGTDADGNPGLGSISGLVSDALNEYISEYEESEVASLSVSNSTDVFQMSTPGLTAMINEIDRHLLDRLLNEHGDAQLPPLLQLPQIENQVTVLDNLNKVLEEKVNNAGSQEDFEAGLFAAQTLGTSIKENSDKINSDDDATANDALDTLGDVADKVGSDEFIDAIKDVKANGQTVDVKQLSDDLSSGGNVDDAVSNATLAEAPAKGEPGIWAQRVLSMSGESENGERGRVMFFFEGDDPSSVDGVVSACYAYNANNDDDDISAVSLTGTWLELNSRGIVQVNSELASFTIKARKQAVIPENELDKYLGLGDSSGADADTIYGHLRFAYDGRQEVWYSDVPVEDATDTQDFGLLESVNIPTTQAECESFEVNGIPNALHKNLGF